jgi:3-hydroxyacyl-CoA dehydrogenase
VKSGVVAIIGAGTIGTGWATAFALKGWHVVLYDPSVAQAQKASMAVGEALRASGTRKDDRSPVGSCTRADSLEQALVDAEFVQEAVPDVLDLKQELFAMASRLLPRTVPIASSTSTFRPSELLHAVPHADRLLVGHPFHPVHIIPLVEVVGSPVTDEAVIARATQVYEGIGKIVIRLRRECTGHLVNRLQAALFREATHLVAEGVATVQDVDRGIAYGPALRWPLTGVFMTWHLAGGPGGVHDYLAKLGPSIELMWRSLGDATLSGEVREKIELQVHDASGTRSTEQMSILRDHMLAELAHWLASREKLI